MKQYAAVIVILVLFSGCVIPGFDSTTTSTTTRVIIPASSTTKLAATSRATTTSTTTTLAGNVLCRMNADCGINGLEAIEEYGCDFPKIYRQHISYKCENPGTVYSKCVARMVPETLKVCNWNERCLKDTPYCSPARDKWEYGRKCEGNNCIILNNTNTTRYRILRKGEYKLSFNYVFSSPPGINLSMQTPTGERYQRYLMGGHDEVIADLTIRLSYATGPDLYAEVLINPNDTKSATTITLPYVNTCIPAEAQVLDGLDYDTFDSVYGQYSFKIKKLFYLDEYSVSSVTLYAKKVRGVAQMTGRKEPVEEVTITPQINGKVDSLLLGVCWDDREHGPVVWVQKMT